MSRILKLLRDMRRSMSSMISVPQKMQQVDHLSQKQNAPEL